MEVISTPAIPKVKSSVPLFSVFPDALKYCDPLHILLEYVAEVRILAWHIIFAAYYTPDINVNYAASI
jgi:hypothetical protein